mmetsp:Transcript_8891/g.16352  ORF Transcript_8891/g.16352 Transcript_8891/m.16352 type:complete len:216 (-) Transcript_8891:286-933(-)
MVVDACVARSTGQVLAFTVRHVLASLRVAKALGQAKVNDVKKVCTSAAAHQKVIGLNVAMNKMLGMHILDSAYELLSDHHNTQRSKGTAAGVEEVFQRGAKQVHYKHIVVCLYTKPAHVRDTNASLQYPVKLALVEQLGVFGANAFELDCHVFPGGHVRSEVNIPERPTTHLAAEAILFAHASLHRVRYSRRGSELYSNTNREPCGVRAPLGCPP